mmetsp:Transcript_11431/g.26916  ORF Transcript_11431/g.26916 Transcript_11431/m.26916 type:complete len:269 (+) Transcript_11431:2749-3555(+)
MLGNGLDDAVLVAGGDVVHPADPGADVATIDLVADPVLGLVLVGLLQRHPAVVVNVLKSLGGQPAAAPAIVEITGAIDELLFGQTFPVRAILVVADAVVRLEGARRAEGPARTAVPLALDGSYDALRPPVDSFGQVDEVGFVVATNEFVIMRIRDRSRRNMSGGATVLPLHEVEGRKFFVGEVGERTVDTHGIRRVSGLVGGIVPLHDAEVGGEYGEAAVVFGRVGRVLVGLGVTSEPDVKVLRCLELFDAATLDFGRSRREDRQDTC